MTRKLSVIAAIALTAGATLIPTTASAGDPAAGAILGGLFGAAVGHGVNGHHGAVVGGVLGALAGASIAAEAGYPAPAYAYPPRPPYPAAPVYVQAPVYAPAPVYVAPAPVYYAPPAVVYRPRPVAVPYVAPPRHHGHRVDHRPQDWHAGHAHGGPGHRHGW